MNRPLVLTGITLSAVVTLTGCGGPKKAATVAQGAAANAPAQAPRRSPAPAPATTVPGTVRVGGFCKTVGTVGKTAKGALARCEKRPGDKRARWYQAVRAGEFCSRQGATAKATNGKKVTCTKKRGETRPRWRAK